MNLRGIKFKVDTYNFLFENINDPTLKGLVDTLRLGLLMKYGETYETSLNEFNKAIGMDNDFLTVEFINSLMFEEIFAAIDFWKLHDYKRFAVSTFNTEAEVLSFYVHENLNEDKVSNYMDSFSLLTRIFYDYNEKLTKEQRIENSILDKFLLVRDYIKNNKINLVASSNFFSGITMKASSQSIANHMVKVQPMAQPNSNIAFLNMVQANTPQTKSSPLASIASTKKNLKKKF